MVLRAHSSSGRKGARDGTQQLVSTRQQTDNIERTETAADESAAGAQLEPRRMSDLSPQKWAKPDVDQVSRYEYTPFSGFLLLKARSLTVFVSRINSLQKKCTSRSFSN